MSGKKNSFNAVLYPDGREKDVLYTIDGQWSEAFVIKDGKTKKVVDSYTAKSNPTTPLTIAPIEEQDPLESRRAWSRVAAAIQKGDMDTTGAEKSTIEHQQRELRKKEQQEGREWERRYFSRVEKDAVFDALAPKIGEKSEPEKTGGMWRWDEEKYQAVISGKGKKSKSSDAAPNTSGHQPVASNKSNNGNDNQSATPAASQVDGTSDELSKAAQPGNEPTDRPNGPTHAAHKQPVTSTTAPSTALSSGSTAENGASSKKEQPEEIPYEGPSSLIHS